jgi:branched-chain amino acid transport system ATP-binding protein
MNPMETAELAGLIRKIHGKYELSVFLIEHDMKFVMGLCDRIKVIEYGHAIAEGPAHEIRHNPAVIKAYLGSGQYAEH